MSGCAEPGRAAEYLDLTESADARERTPGPRAAGDDIAILPVGAVRRPGRGARIAARLARLIRRR